MPSGGAVFAPERIRVLWVRRPHTRRGSSSCAGAPSPSRAPPGRLRLRSGARSKLIEPGAATRYGWQPTAARRSRLSRAPTDAQNAALSETPHVRRTPRESKYSMTHACAVLLSSRRRQQPVVAACPGCTATRAVAGPARRRRRRSRSWRGTGRASSSHMTPALVSARATRHGVTTVRMAPRSRDGSQGGS
jgi:hypothetical protein